MKGTLYTFKVANDLGQAVGENNVFVTKEPDCPFKGLSVYEIMEKVKENLPPGFGLEHLRTQENSDPPKPIEPAEQVVGRIIIEHVAGKGSRWQMEGAFPINEAVFQLGCLQAALINQQLNQAAQQNQPKLVLPNGPIPPPKGKFRM